MPRINCEPVDFAAGPRPVSAASVEEVSSLAWLIIDGVASDAEQQRLADLLSQEPALRQPYIQAIQLDTQLQGLFVKGIAPLSAV